MSSEIKINKINTSLGKVTLLRKIGKGKSGYSFLAGLNDQLVVFKRMHNEPCPYYTFSDNKVQLEVQAYRSLHQIGIPIPQLLCFSLEENYLVKEYIEGTCGHEWLAHGVQDEAVIEQLFSISSELRAHGLNIDYFPPNFVIGRGEVYYVDYEINPYNDAWSSGEFTIGPTGPGWPSMPEAGTGEASTKMPVPGYRLRLHLKNKSASGERSSSASRHGCTSNI